MDHPDHETSIAATFRRLTPALSRISRGKKSVYLDAPGGTQMPQPVLDAMKRYVIRGMANRHGAFDTSIETEEILARARDQVRALLGADGYVIVFGQNMTSLTFELATSLARDWSPGRSRDEVVVSEIDHHANVDPWRSVASDRDMSLRWLPVDTERVCLDLSHLGDVITDRCAVTAVGLASNAVGTIQDVAAIAERAHAVGGIVVVDAVHAVPHIPVDCAAMGADVLLCSAYKFFGPHVGIMAIREDLLDRIRFYKVAPAPDHGPAKAEMGSQNHEALAGLSATIDFLESLHDGATQVERLAGTMTAIAEAEAPVSAVLCDRLAALPGVRVYRAPAGHPKTPTVAFTCQGVAPEEVARRCAEQAVFVTNGDFYATTLAARLGVSESGGWVRVGLAPYLGIAEVERAVDVIASVSRLGTERKAG
ncbi:MAG: cysteine desulfurase-like protein [Streptosporangiaceae bacterium]